MTSQRSDPFLLRIAMTACPVCGRDTRNPKFCSRSCAAKQNNVLVPKRKLGGTCAVCGSLIPRRHRYCPDHRPNRPLDRSQPIASVADASEHPACRHARLRQDARRQYLLAFPYRCARCGYDKHIEVCHRRALTSFPLDTPIAVVNSLENLIGLCPNCHWEFDHGLLQL
jgi:predicted nucleic acid-binding Zn ribbon protein